MLVVTTAIPFSELGLPDLFSTIADAAEIIDSGSCGVYGADNVKYTLDSNGLLTFSGSGYMEVYSQYSDVPWYGRTITSVVIEYGILNISSFAFYKCSTLKDIYIPDSVTKIYVEAFRDCVNLKNINLPQGLKSVGLMAFYNCSGLESLFIPKNVEIISEYKTFHGCSNLKNISVDDDNQFYCDIDGVLFNKNCTKLITFPPQKQCSEYFIPGSVTAIHDEAFRGCDLLTRVYIPYTVNSIGQSAFENCTSITEISIPDGITVLNDDVFRCCEKLSDISVPQSVTKLGARAFYGCKSLKKIDLPKNLISIGINCFAWCTALADYTIPQNITVIEHGAFYGTATTKVSIPNGVTRIEEGAFGSTDLKEIKIPENVTEIGEGAFRYAYFTTLEIPDNVTSVGEYAFECYISSLKITSSTTKIASSAFSYSSNITNTRIKHVHIPSDTTASDYAGKYGLPSDTSIFFYDDTCQDCSCPFRTQSKAEKPVDPSSLNNNTGTNNPNISNNSNGNVLTSAVIKYDSEERKENLVNTYFKYHLVKDKKGADKHSFQIICTPVDESAVDHYEFFKGTDCFAISSTNTLTVYDNQLTDSDIIAVGDVFINVVNKDGTSYKTKLKLDITHNLEGLMETEITLGGKDDLSIAIPDNVPFIGGDKMALSFFPSPVYAVIKPDGTIRVAVNVINKDLLDKDSEWDNYKNRLNAIDKFKKGAPYKNAIINFKDLSEITKYIKCSDPKQCKLFDPDAEFNMIFTGYAEGKITDLNNASLKFNFVLGIEWHGSITWQTFVVVVPVVVEAGLKMSANVTGDLQWNIDESGLDFTGELYLDSKIAVDVFGGVGVAKVASVGASGGGEITSKLILLSNKQRTGFDNVEAKLKLNLVAKLFGWKYEHKLAEKTYKIFERGDSSAGAESFDNHVMLDFLYDQNNYVIAYDSANEDFCLTADGTNADNSIIVSGLLCSASPEIILTDSGILMTYISADVERGAANSSVLKYMTYDEMTGTWSEAKQLDDNGTLDWFSKLYSFGGKTYVAYSQSDKIFSNDASVENMLSEMKITVAEYDASTNSFVNLTDISTDDARYNSMPELVSIGGKLAALWVNSPAEDMFNQNNDNSVMYSVYDNGTWSTAATAASGLNTVTSVIAGDIDGKTYFCICVDSDSNLSTAGDSKVVFVDVNGSQTIITEGNVANVHFGKLPFIEKNVFYWYENGDIKYADSPDTTVSVFEESNINVSNDFSVASDRVLFTTGSAAGGASVYQTVFNNGIWTSPVVVETADGNISSFTACDGILVYSDTVLTSDSESNEISDRTSIGIARYLEKYDIGLAKIDYDYTQIKPGRQIDLDLYVTNHTDTVLKNVDVAIGSYKTSAACSIDPGETGIVTVKFTIPSVIDDTQFTVIIKGAKEDTNPVDNSARFDFSRTEMSLVVTNRIIDNKSYYIAAISNESNISAGCTLRVMNEAGKEIYTKQIENIPANNIFYHMVSLEELGCGDTDTITSEIVADKEEYNTFNNITHQYVAKIDEYLPYVVVAFMNADGSEISRNAYELGKEITVPELPKGATTWLEYGVTDTKPVISFDDIKHDSVFVAAFPLADVKQPYSTPITYGQALADSQLTNGWSWADATVIPDVQNDGFIVTKTLTDDNIFDYSNIDGSFTYDAEEHTLSTKINVSVNPVKLADNTNKSQSFSCGSINIEAPKFYGIDGSALSGSVSYIYNGKAVSLSALNEQLNKIVDIEFDTLEYTFMPESDNYKSVSDEMRVIFSDSLKFIDSGVSSTDDIGVSVRIRIPEVSVRNGAHLKYVVGDKATILPVSGAEKTESEYSFILSVAPAEMTDTINVKYIYDDNEVMVYSGTAADIVMTALSQAEDTTMELFLKSMLNYGTQAQLFFVHNADKLANSLLDESDKALTAISAGDLLSYSYRILDKDSNIDFIGQAITLDSIVTSKFYFSGEITLEMCTVNGTEITSDDIGTDEKGTYIAICDIAPENFDKSFTIIVGDVEVTNASVFSYLYTALKNERTDLLDLVYSMYSYSQVAKLYKDCDKRV